MKFNAANVWHNIYKKSSSISYPAEGVIRIFKGSFPKLKMDKPLEGAKILDVGCGDGRHLSFFESIGLKADGVEISDDICTTVKKNLNDIGLDFDIVTGHCGELPYESDTFDFLLTWNSCYYMSLNHTTFSDHVLEMARVIKKNGWIIASIPKEDCFIFKDSLPASKAGYRVIVNDYFGARDGELMRCFNSIEEIKSCFSSKFTDFSVAEINMDWFGLSYKWHIFVARKK